ncbi:phenylalanine--tRNA ligase subunit beta [Patescibacteria group bacterium]|nr:phenylalanine--tRNA ligase subunit beta [Patescibacteria group bacterium]
MLFSYNWLQECSKAKLPKPDTLADLLTMHAFEVENLEKKGGDWILNIDVLPNRAHDTLNHMGMAREIAAITGKTVAPSKKSAIRPKKGTLEHLRVTIQSARKVPRYHAIVIEGIRIMESPKWMKQRLEALEINAINNVVDIANYVMMETGQPLHAFDYERIQGHQMNIRDSKKGEKIVTLEGQTLELPRGALVIDDTQGIIDLAGIKGGKVSGISAKTKHIVVQAASFDAETVYRAKKRLGYTTPAADLYAHGIDPNLSDEALERALYLLQQSGGGEVIQVIDMYPAKVMQKSIQLDLNYAESLLGIKISEKDAKNILGNLGCGVKKGKGTRQLRVEVPTRRLDLTIPEDLVEEIGRIIGYEKIEPQLPKMPIQPAEVNQELFWQDRIKDSLKEAGFTEVYNYSFAGEKDLTNFLYSEKDKRLLVQLQNPQSEEYKYMRSNLLENLVKNVAQNQQSVQHIRIFETGKIFIQEKQVKEISMISGMLTGVNSFYEIKGVVDFMLNRLGISDIWYDQYKPSPQRSRSALWHQNRVAEIKVGAIRIGFLGEISKAVAANMKLADRVAAFHIDFEKLVKVSMEEKEYRPVSKFPSVVRDIAILLPREVKVVEVLNRINQSGGALVEDVDLFDMYEGDELPEGQKNLAFHIMYQSPDKTLTGKEVDGIHNQIIKALEQDPEWEVRK